MIRGMYTAASGMVAAQMANDTMANNMANLSTVGYKSVGATYQSFPEMLIKRVSGGEQKEVGSIMTGARIRETRTRFDQGDLQETGNTFDLALNGNGFFTIEPKNGGTERYTRAGNFAINDQGYLTTVNGDYVKGESGRIQLDMSAGPYLINPQGQISGKNGPVNTLQITRFADDRALLKAGDTQFERGPAAEEVTDGSVPGFSVQQGKLERSNSNAVQEMVRSIEGMRLYEALQKNIQLQNSALEKTVNDVGRYK